MSDSSSLVGRLRECVVDGRDSVTPDLLEEAADALALKDTQLQEAERSVAALAKQCGELEADREYNAELVRQRDAQLMVLLAEIEAAQR